MENTVSIEQKVDFFCQNFRNVFSFHHQWHRGKREQGFYREKAMRGKRDNGRMRRGDFCVRQPETLTEHVFLTR